MSDNNVLRFSSKMKIVSGNGVVSNVIVTDEASPGKDIAAAAKDDELKSKLDAAYQQGWKSCETQMTAKVQALTQQLDAAAKQIPQSLAKYFETLEKDMRSEVGELAFSIAAMVLGHEVENASSLNSLVQEMLAPILDLHNVKLYLNPAIASMSGGPEVPSGVKVLPDSRLKPGEALLECSQGIVDGTLEGRLNTLKDAFARFLEERNAKGNA